MNYYDEAKVLRDCESRRLDPPEGREEHHEACPLSDPKEEFAECICDDIKRDLIADAAEEKWKAEREG